MNVKKLMIGAMVAATLSSCQKEEQYSRNYGYPLDLNNPLKTLAGGNILVEAGESDESIMKRIREFEYYGKDLSDTVEFPYIFLSPTIYLDGKEDVSPCNLNPDYLLFPHSFGYYICLNGETKDVREYVDELREIGEKAFCDKYFNGKRTLGMRLQ